MKLLVYFSVVVLLFGFNVAVTSAQCMAVELPLSARIGEADVVVEGEIQGIRYFRSGGKVFTAYLVNIYKRFKGDVSESVLEVTAPGGFMDGRYYDVQPNFFAEVGQKGIFTLTNNPLAQDAATSLPQFYAFAAQQSAVYYSKENGVAQDVFQSYANIEKELYLPIQKHVGSKYHSLREFSAQSYIRQSEKSEASLKTTATISNISPNVVRGGIGETVTITGSGFGSRGANSVVQFRSSDDGGQSWIGAPSNHIVRWQDNEIVVMVPGGLYFTQSGAFRSSAGTGAIRVQPQSGSPALSPQTLTINYTVNVRSFPDGQNSFTTYFPNLIDNNGNGGYTFRPSAAMKANQPAVDVFKRSLEKWRCGTGLNCQYADETSTSNCSDEDNLNTVAMSSTSCPMPFQGVLAYASSIWTNSPCAGSDNASHFFIAELDVVINKDINWNYTTGATTGGKYDLQSVLTHELGHAHQLGHVIDSKKIMHFAVGPNTNFRELNPDSDVLGGQDILARSITMPCPTKAKMRLVPKTNCTLTGPQAGFSVASSSSRSGCIPLTVEFQDVSLNAPTQWLWDLDGDNKNDFATKNATFTYTKAGTYSVRLIVRSGQISDTLIQKNFISAFPYPNITMNDNIVVCPDSIVSIGGSNLNVEGTGPFQYTWTPTSGIVSGRLTSSPRVNPNSSTTYTLSVRDANGCVGKDSVKVELLQTTKPQIVRTGDMLSSSVQASAYQWIADGKPIAGANSKDYSPTSNGKYAVQTKDDQGCFSTSDEFLYAATGIAEYESETAPWIYPNPADGTFTLFNPKEGSLNYSLYSSLGVLAISGESLQKAQRVDIGFLPAGIYFIRCTIENSVVVLPLTKQ